MARIIQGRTDAGLEAPMRRRLIAGKAQAHPQYKVLSEGFRDYTACTHWRSRVLSRGSGSATKCNIRCYMREGAKFAQ